MSAWASTISTQELGWAAALDEVYRNVGKQTLDQRDARIKVDRVAFFRNSAVRTYIPDAVVHARDEGE